MLGIPELGERKGYNESAIKIEQRSLCVTLTREKVSLTFAPKGLNLSRGTQPQF